MSKYVTLCQRCAGEAIAKGEIKEKEVQDGMACVVKCGICSRCGLRRIVDIYDAVEEPKIVRGNSTYYGVVEIEGEIACAKCKTIGPKAKMVMHMDGTDFYTNVFECECGNRIQQDSKRSMEDAAYWRCDEEEPATSKQISYAVRLCRELGYELEDYDFQRMSKTKISKLIGEFKAELEG